MKHAFFASLISFLVPLFDASAFGATSAYRVFGEENYNAILQSAWKKMGKAWVIHFHRAEDVKSTKGNFGQVAHGGQLLCLLGSTQDYCDFYVNLTSLADYGSPDQKNMSGVSYQNRIAYHKDLTTIRSSRWVVTSAGSHDAPKTTEFLPETGKSPVKVTCRSSYFEKPEVPGDPDVYVPHECVVFYDDGN